MFVRFFPRARAPKSKTDKTQEGRALPATETLLGDMDGDCPNRKGQVDNLIQPLFAWELEGVR